MRQNAAERRAVGSVLEDVAKLATMTVDELARKHLEIFGVPTRSRNRLYLQRTVAWKLQEKTEGGLSTRALARLSELGDELPKRWQGRVAEHRGPVLSSRDRWLPPPGSTLTRTFRGAVHTVKVLHEGFEYEGHTYPTLSRIARDITGTAWNGYAFFHLEGERTRERSDP